MRIRPVLCFVVLAICAMTASAQPSRTPAPSIELTARTPLPKEVRGQLGQMSLVESQIVVLAEEAGVIAVIERSGRSPARASKPIDAPRGLAALSGWSARRVAHIACADGKLRTFSLDTLEELSQFSIGEEAGVVQLPRMPVGRGYAAYKDNAGAGLARFDSLNSTSRMERLELGSLPGPYVLVPRPNQAIGESLAFITLPQTREVVLADVEKMQVNSRWKLREGDYTAITAAPVYSSRGLREGYRVFVGCRGGMILILDGDTGRETGRVSCTRDPGALFFSKEAGQLIAVCGGGTIDVFQQGDDIGPAKERWTRTQRTTTAPGARAAVLTPKGLGTPEQLHVAIPARADEFGELRTYSIGAK